MSPAVIKNNTYVPADQVQIGTPFKFDRRVFLAQITSGAERFSGVIDSVVASSLLVCDALKPLISPNEFLTADDLTLIEKAARRLMMVISVAKEGIHDVFTEEEIIALAFDAGCAVTVVEDANGAEFLPIKVIRVERRPDGLIVVYEDGATEGVVLER